MSTKITKKPDKTVTGLGAPTRGSGNHKMTAKWNVPASMNKSTSESRATGLYLKWVLNVGGKKKTLKKEASISARSSTINLNDITIGGTQYTRNSFYPLTKKMLRSVTVSVQGTNSKGKGKAVTQTRTFKKPRTPVVEQITFNTSNGRCGTTITTNAGADYNERYDTYYRVTVVTADGQTINPQTGVTITYGQSIINDAPPQGARTNTEFTIEYDVSGYQTLTEDQFIKVTIEAWARGYAGKSGTTTRSYYVSKPKPATIEGATVSSKDSTGIFTAYINTNKSKEHPVDTVRLEYLPNTTYEDAASIPPNAKWEDSGIEDNGDCTALSVPLSIDENFVPDRGKHTWIRVKSFHANEAVLYNYSEYRNIEELETPPAVATEDTIEILSATAGENGTSAVVLLGWNQSGTDDSAGTELTWSEEEDTWKSTDDPSLHEFEWSDGELIHGETTYHDSAEIVIKGLTEGVKYYIRARRYYEGETTSYSRYSNTATVITNEKPMAVVASCGKYLTEGEPLPVYWTYSGSGLQESWRIEDSNGTTVAEGEGSEGSARINWERIAALAVNNAITLRVWVSTGSKPKESEWHTVYIMEKPTLTITAPSTLTAQPFSFTAESDKLCDLVVIVTSQGASGQYPEGFKIQTEGDTVHSDVYTPTWDDGEVEIALPDGLDFWDLGSYTLSVVAIDRETGLRSDEILSDFDIAWTNKAQDPDAFVTLIPLDYMTDDGEHVQAVRISMTPPTNSAATDEYDIYRMDGGTAHLIGEGFPLTATVEDAYAPFSTNEELFYRVALRTVDGDVEFTDKPYTLESNTVRFDWQGGSLELPYGITIADNYSKDVEFRQHMDGSVDGYWNPNIQRKGQYSSAIIKLIQLEEINLARQLARYAGAVFVRTANGSAYPADVQVTDLSVKNEAITAVAFDATEVGLTEEFMLPSPFELEDE